MKKIHAVALILICTASLSSWAGDKKDKKKEKVAATVVDSGSFGVFVSGRRVATETFTVKQLPDMSITESDIKLEGSNQAQHSELQLTPRGDLIKYDWKESGGSEKGETTVEPSQQFLMQKVKANDKYTEQPYLMPSSTAILDDYFFSHRELLLWRYVGGSCDPKEAAQGCAMQKAQYGFVVPRQRTSGMATVNYIGRDTIQLHGSAVQVNKFSLQSDFGDWVLFMDPANKLVKVVIVGEGTEVVRD